jgi:phosphoribosylformimino-5-aminoimidazole carboxamide ribotide isomerase
MKVFPAVDILAGSCVQLVQGKRETATRYGTPLDCAFRWKEEGADALHVVNLDGAFGNLGANADLIREIIQKTGLMIELGGGIRTYEDAARWLESGVERVILGTAAVQDPGLLRSLSRDFGRSRVMAGVDSLKGRIATSGWEETAGDYISFARRFEAEGAGFLLYTNVDVEGLQQGISPGPVARLIASVQVPVVVAGGVSSPEDIRELKKIGAHGVVLGSALYAGRLRLRDALEAADENC